MKPRSKPLRSYSPDPDPDPAWLVRAVITGLLLAAMFFLVLSI
jgi:hypothetical protein